MKLQPRMGLTMFDLLKGSIVIIAILRHTLIFLNLKDTLPVRILEATLIPALFVVSGYWLKKRKVKDGIANSAKFLLVPYVIVALIIISVGGVHRALIHNMKDWTDVFLISTLLVISGERGRLVSVWFVFALFIAWCVYYLVINILRERGQIIAACVCGLAGGLSLQFQLPFQISQGLIAFFYVYAGYLIKRKKLLEKRIAPRVYVLLIAVWLAGGCLGSMDLALYKIRNSLIIIPAALCGAFLLIRLFLYLNDLDWRVLEPVRLAGRYSLWVLCIHNVEDGVFPWKLLVRFIPRTSFPNLMLYFLLRLALIAALCRVMVWCKQRVSAKEPVAGKGKGG